MKREFIWLTLFLSSTSAGSIKIGVRVRAITTPYRNASQPVDATTTIGYSSHISDESDADTSPTGSSRLPRTDIIGSDESNTNTDALTSVTSTSASGGFVTSLSGDDGPSLTGCIPSVVTYTGLVPDTVYVTTDTSYKVTVSASNVSMTAPTIYETPQPACSTTVVSTNTNLPPLWISTEAPDSITALTMTDWGTETSPGPFGLSQIMLKLTSTVTVTKKTPVLVVHTMTFPRLTFGSPMIKTDPVLQTPSYTARSGGGGNHISSSDDTLDLSSDSVITTKFLAAPATPIIAGMPITVGPSSIAIGDQTVTLPTATPITIVVNSQTFTVNPSEIIGSSTTFQLQNQLVATPTITQAPSIISKAGVVLTIGATTVVLSGTTYRIGPGAVPTTVTANGQTIAIGTDGVAFLGVSPTTYARAMTVAGGNEIVTVASVTVAINQTEAVISGTTFRIGDGGPTTTVTFGSQTITIGPSGVVLASTTIPPTTVPNIEPSIGLASSSTSTATSPSSGGTDQHNLGVTVQQSGFLHLLSWLLPFFLALVPPI